MELKIIAIQNKKVTKIIKSNGWTIPNKLQILLIKFILNKSCGLERTVKNGITVAKENISAKPEKKVKMNRNRTWYFLLLWSHFHIWKKLSKYFE